MPGRFRFVRDGFSLWAFLFGPLWMLRHRMWLVLIGYLVLVALLAVGPRFVGAGSVLCFAAVLMALLVGMEAGTLRRFTLGRRGWNNVGVVVADDIELAERRFFDSWAGRAPQTSPAPASGNLRHAAASSDVIGLFPEPGGSR